MHTAAARQTLQTRLFPKGIPRLWCPTLTHFQAAHIPDPARIRAHLSALSPHVHGILVPGSTGEGWEMNDEEIRALLAIVLDAAQKLGMRVLIGVLKTQVEEMHLSIEAIGALRDHPAVAGITVCPPKGVSLSQTEIQTALAGILDLGWPTALYQLPQVTQNEMEAATVAALAEEFPNFILFKDTSGADRVAKSGRDFGGVFLVRGAEGHYATWPRRAGGPYDGFLLSTANVFASHFAKLLQMLDQGNAHEAQALSSKIDGIVTQAFQMVSAFPSGNAFTNANKALDHCMAFGESVPSVEPPLLYSGVRLPVEFIRHSMDLLRENGLLPKSGYFSPASS